jgi:hypothetical protein
MTPRGPLGIALGATIALAWVASAASTSIEITTPIPGSLEVSDAGHSQERISIPEAVVSVLTESDEDAEVIITDWPAAPGLHLRVALRRRRMVDPEARMLLIEAAGVRPLAPSSRIHFLGESEPRDHRIMLAVNPADSSLHGLSIVDGEIYQVVPSPDGHLVLSAADRVRALGGDPDAWSCSLEDGAHLAPRSLPPGSEAVAAKGGESASRSATIAFDTDTELLQLKFNNNQTAALDYIADLVAAMNVMYERDLGVTLLQGDTIIRIGSDPWVQNSGGNASPAELNEFGSYWNAHYDHIDRALAAMLSGKQPSNYSASGIAWVGGLCSHSYGYSFSKVFKVDYLPGDAFVVGHELGHNFGSRHTHCYSPPIDECYANEGGCYSGPTSCPGGPGTVMSYCHIAGCGSNRLEFHSRVITNIVNNHVNPATGICIFESAEALFADGFESGNLDAWSITVP